MRVPRRPTRACQCRGARLSLRDPYPGALTGAHRHRRYFLLNPGPVTPYVEQLNIGVGRRALAISLAVLISALLLLMLLTFGSVGKPDSRTERVSMVSLEASGIAGEAPEPSAAKAERSKQQPEPKPQAEETPPTKPSEPQPLPAVQPVPAPPSPAPVVQQPSPAIARPVLRPGIYGPPNTGGSSSSFRDSERVGTAPNGEPLYAATWYRQPSDDELRGYLSTASGPGWGLIACRTAPDYRVEDCVGLDEYPTGSQINRAVLAAAWQFKVRPPRLGGKLLVGSWVRIRIDYVMRRQ